MPLSDSDLDAWIDRVAGTWELDGDRFILSPTDDGSIETLHPDGSPAEGVSPTYIAARGRKIADPES